MRLHDWPQRDQELLAQVTAPGGLLDDSGRGAEWMPKTRRSHVWVYGRWLTFLTLGLGLDLAEDPGERATRENLAAFIAALRGQGAASLTIFSYLKGVYVTLSFMLPERNWSWLRDEVNQYGGTLTYGGIGDRLVELSKRHLKKRFASHSFRHGLASALVDVAPEQAMAAAGLLGNGFATADANYIHSTSKIASRVQNEIVGDLRAGFRNEQADATNKPRGRA
jgi:hypothetical protein